MIFDVHLLGHSPSPGSLSHYFFSVCYSCTSNRTTWRDFENTRIWVIIMRLVCFKTKKLIPGRKNPMPWNTDLKNPWVLPPQNEAKIHNPHLISCLTMPSFHLLGPMCQIQRLPKSESFGSVCSKWLFSPGVPCGACPLVSRRGSWITTCGWTLESENLGRCVWV